MLIGVGLSVATARSENVSLTAPAGEVQLTLTGKIHKTNSEGAALLDDAMLEALPRHTLKTSTVVTDGVKRFDGFLMRDLLEFVGADGTTVTASALNDYTIDIPMEDFVRYDVLVATHMDGERLQPSDKGPFWIVYPRDGHSDLQDIRYDYRWVWQLIQLKIK